MRLIDADDLKKDDEVTEWITKDAIRTGKMLKAFSELFVKKIDAAPTIQAVPIDVLGKIRAEIEELTKCSYGTECLGANCPSNTDCMICGDHVLEIIDKYKAESEET